VVIGGAFGAVVTALVQDLITPLIAAIAGKPDLPAIQLKVNASKLLLGDFINALVSVSAKDGTVYLTGNVRSFFVRDEAACAA